MAKKARAKTRKYADILYEVKDQIAWITINRPRVMNAFREQSLDEMIDAVKSTREDPSIAAIVFKGAGNDAFSAGGDFYAMKRLNWTNGAMWNDRMQGLAMAIRGVPIPVIAMVNGVAAGAGANFALGCDIVIAAKSASFIQAFSKIGLIPDCGGTWLLPRLVGRAKAIGLAMTGDKLPAEAAERMGLIWAAVDDAALQDQTLALAQRLAAMPVKALAATRRTIDASIMVDYASALSLEARVQNDMGAQPDFREGVAAFLEKRAARFNDR